MVADTSPSAARQYDRPTPERATRFSKSVVSRVSTTVLLVAVILAGLPVAVWLDMRNLSEQALRDYADDLTLMINNIRNYYADNVVERVLAGGEKTLVLPNYATVPGAIPIPATLSLELGDLVSLHNGNVGFRFFSDLPFKNRAPHTFDAFEQQALESLRRDPKARIYQASGSVFDRRVRLITPIVMAAGCVGCHNSHPDSPKKDWKVGEVRGIEEFIVSQPIASHILAFKYLLIYFIVAAIIGLGFIKLQRRAVDLDCTIQQRARKDQFVPVEPGAENRQISAAPALSRHLQRTNGCRDRNRAQEADNSLFGHRQLHVDHRAHAA